MAMCLHTCSVDQDHFNPPTLIGPVADGMDLFAGMLLCVRSGWKTQPMFTGSADRITTPRGTRTVWGG
jgi:hypothetical protein